jgi:hypothetical protein
LNPDSTYQAKLQIILASTKEKIKMAVGKTSRPTWKVFWYHGIMIS